MNDELNELRGRLREAEQPVDVVVDVVSSYQRLTPF
jgi:hypothetical protein